MTLAANSYTVIVGQQINLTCTTSYCNPPANITWFKSTTDITNQSTFTRYTLDGLVKTSSQLLSWVVKTDNGQNVFCTASNTPSRNVNSMMYRLTIWCKNTLFFKNVFELRFKQKKINNLCNARKSRHSYI